MDCVMKNVFSFKFLKRKMLQNRNFRKICEDMIPLFVNFFITQQKIPFERSFSIKSRTFDVIAR